RVKAVGVDGSAAGADGERSAGWVEGCAVLKLAAGVENDALCELAEADVLADFEGAGVDDHRVDEPAARASGIVREQREGSGPVLDEVDARGAAEDLAGDGDVAVGGHGWPAAAVLRDQNVSIGVDRHVA